MKNLSNEAGASRLPITRRPKSLRLFSIGASFHSGTDAVRMLNSVDKCKRECDQIESGYKVSTFYHTGDLGDIIAALPVIRHLGGGELFIGNHPKEFIKQWGNDLRWMKGLRISFFTSILVVRQPFRPRHHSAHTVTLDCQMEVFRVSWIFAVQQSSRARLSGDCFLCPTDGFESCRKSSD